MIYALSTKSVGLEGKGLYKFIGESSERMCLDKKKIQEYFLKI